MIFADLPIWAKIDIFACVGLVLLALWLDYLELNHGKRRNKNGY